MFKTANNDSISRPNSRPKLPFPGNGKGKFKMPREGKGQEIWGLYSRESRETGIPAQPCSGDPGGQSWLYLEIPKIIFSSDQLDIWYGNHYIIMIFTKYANKDKFFYDWLLKCEWKALE